MKDRRAIRAYRDLESRSANENKPAKIRRLAVNKKTADLDAEVEETMRRARQAVAELMDPGLIDLEQAGSFFDRMNGGLFGADPVSRRPAAALQRLRKRFERGAGLRGVRLAELALRAGLTPPARQLEPATSGPLEAALWMELARENAALRREAAKLAERKQTLVRRIQRARTRLQTLRLKLVQRRLGLNRSSLTGIPLPTSWQQLGIWQEPSRAATATKAAAGRAKVRSAERPAGEAAKPEANESGVENK